MDFEARSIVQSHEQKRLDGERTAAERNKLGQFATPLPLAIEITHAVAELCGQTPKRFLEPSLGLGSFYLSCLHVFESIDVAVGVELDPRLAQAADQLWSDSGLKVIEADFTRLAPPEAKDRFDLILANPPYVRHHHLDKDEKARLQGLVQDRLSIHVSGLAGLYVAFLLLADAWLSPEGVAAWLIPSEFLDVNYGSALRTYLVDHVNTLRIHRFLPSDTQFADALVTSTVVIFTKSGKPPVSIRFTEGGTLLKPTNDIYLDVSKLKHANKWSNERIVTNDRSQTALGDLFTIRRGIATGSNRFFILDRTAAFDRGIPGSVLRPILPGARNLHHDIIESDSDGYPSIARQLALLDCRVRFEEVESPALRAYLFEGQTLAIHQGYLTSRRSPWYLQEQREVAPFLCTYMGRSQVGGNPFRFLWNKSEAIAANTYLMLIPREPLRQRMIDSPELSPAIFAWLQSRTRESLTREGRVYGGGLHKIEPRELACLPADELRELIRSL